ncbi:MAG: 50S ribosomal protein L30 [Alphaproteobacteria bacterium]|nr:50S ribosomal protein L30 [Alphaproteobacteria bacterium]
MVTAMKKVDAKKAVKTIVVRQVGGTSGNGPKMKETLLGLGLGRTNAVRELQDTPETRGMINRVRHLVRVEDKNRAG